MTELGHGNLLSGTFNNNNNSTAAKFVGAGRIAVNIAKLPELLSRRQTL
jgi:hypothetical protein